MKKVKFTGKLSLNKETVANLNNDQMNSVQGGKLGPSFGGTCYNTCFGGPGEGTAIVCCATRTTCPGTN